MSFAPLEKIQVAMVSLDKEILELFLDFPELEFLGVFDPRQNLGEGIRCLGTDSDWDEIRKTHPRLKLLMALDPAIPKKKLFLHYGPDRFISLVAKDAYLSPTSVIGAGCVIQRRAQILAAAKIGVACKINGGVTVHHDSVVGDFCTLAPGSRMLGSSVLGEQVYLGAGAIVLPNIKVGSRAIIGAGTVVVNDLEPDQTYVGIPAKPVSR